jgi:2-amino-4-hydroxy-6-hydroxymethyldihydropteridine diphosphokinase
MLTAQQLCAASMSCPRIATVTVVALGSNMHSSEGGPVTNVKCGLALLKSRGLVPIAVSPIYRSAAIGGGRQQAFANAVAVVVSEMAIGRMLRVVKQIERQMGRKAGVRWGPRPLDIDILSHRGQMASGQALGWVGRTARPTARKRGQAVLPHPEIHKRMFVLRPMCDIMPHWIHPVFNKSAQQLLQIIQMNEANVLRVAADDIITD